MHRPLSVHDISASAAHGVWQWLRRSRLAKAQGKTLGRPKVNGKIEKTVLAARVMGTGKRKISKQLGIGVSTVNRILSEAA